jgi:hypothetical protein
VLNSKLAKDRFEIEFFVEIIWRVFFTLFGAAPHTALRTSDHDDYPLLSVQKLKPDISTTNGADRDARAHSQKPVSRKMRWNWAPSGLQFSPEVHKEVDAL